MNDRDVNLVLNRRMGLQARWLAGVGMLLTVLLGGCQQADEAAAGDAGTGDAALVDDTAKASYVLGYLFAENVKGQFGDDVELQAFLAGARDQFAGTKSVVEDAEAERVLGVMVEQRQVAAAASASANLDAGVAFLEENAGREGVTSLPSGLQYEVLTAAEGEHPGPSDTVTTHYEGRLIDGTVFDSSYQRGEPVSFPLNRVIAGWTEGLQLMAPGAKYRLYVPAELAYGDREAGQIPANSALVFDVELLSIDQADASADDH